MAKVFQTTMSPTKLELLTHWLPDQPWYVDTGHEPQLTRVGGFRLDDPAGRVGIEFVFVRDEAAGGGTAYHVPMTYRGEPLPAGEGALIGTSEHGVLGRRWIYDGVQDPVLTAQVVALVRGDVEAQHQSQSDTVDRSVNVRSADVRKQPAGQSARVQVVRVLGSDAGRDDGPASGSAQVEAPWATADGSAGRGPVLVVRWEV